MRIINNTNIASVRLLKLYNEELQSVIDRNIECIVFDTCSMVVYGIDCILLEVRE